MLDGTFSELFWAGFIVSVIGCSIKLFKMCITNCRQIDCMGMTIFNSTLYESFVNRTSSNASSSSSLVRGTNPMLPGPLLNA